VTNILDLVLVERGDGIDDDPGERPAKVDNLVHDEAHDSRRKNVILPPQIPSLFEKSTRQFPITVIVMVEMVAAYRPEALSHV
jgi:hypothetical protein